jgi:hypothetical protein
LGKEREMEIFTAVVVVAWVVEMWTAVGEVEAVAAFAAF